MVTFFPRCRCVQIDLFDFERVFAPFLTKKANSSSYLHLTMNSFDPNRMRLSSSLIAPAGISLALRLTKCCWANKRAMQRNNKFKDILLNNAVMPIHLARSHKLNRWSFYLLFTHILWHGLHVGLFVPFGFFVFFPRPKQRSCWLSLSAKTDQRRRRRRRSQCLPA